jgi:hypothetical protein
MDIEQAQKKKQDLERRIFKEVQRFEEETDLSVSGVSLDTRSIVGDDGREKVKPVNVQVDVEM